MTPLLPHRRPNAFTLLEVLSVTAIIGLLAGVALINLGKIAENSRITKLQTDVTTVNQAIKIYTANGGRLTDAASHGFFGDPIEQKILDKLKTRRNRFSAETFAGISGEMIDKRIAARMQNADQVSNPKPRAVWDSATNQFVIQTSGSGVHEFYLKDELETHNYGVDEGRRASAINVSNEPGWIWEFEENPTPLRPAGPTPIALSDPVDSDNPGDDSETSGEGDDDNDDDAGDDGPITLRSLSRPRINPPGGVYGASSFPLTVTVENPNNDAPETWIMVSINGGTPEYYEGPFTVPANTAVRAYVAGPPATFSNSASDYERYITQLGLPSFSPWPQSYAMSQYPMEVTMSHRNDPSAWIMYTLNGGPLQRYTTPVTVEADTAIQAFVQTPSTEWVNSSSRTGIYTGYKEDLRVLSINTSASEFDENVDSISVTIDQPAANPSGSSEISYAITEKGAPAPELASFQTYSAPFENTFSDFPTGFTVHAYADSLDDEVWNDGPMRSVSTSVDFFGVGVAKSTLFMLDFSGSMDQQAYQSTLTRLEVLKSEMNIGMDALSEHDRFGVLIFSSVPHWATTEGLVKVTSDTQTLEMHPGTDAAKAQVSAVIDSTRDKRFTNFLRALSVVDQISPQPEQIVFLTDGTPTVGDGSTEDLNNEWLAGLAEIVDLGIPVHAIGVDLRKQSRLDRLDYIADQTGGTSNLVGDPNLFADEWSP